MAASRLRLDDDAPSVKQQAETIGVTRARVYQLLEDCGKVMEVRWPEGRWFFAPLATWFGSFGFFAQPATANAAILWTPPAGVGLIRLTGLPFWDITAFTAGDGARRIGASSSSADGEFTVVGDLLGGTGGQLPVLGITPGVLGDAFGDADTANTSIEILLISALGGCAFVMLSDAARGAIDGTTSSSFACDLKKWLQIMEAYENGGHAYHTTMPTDALARSGLRPVSIEEIFAVYPKRERGVYDARDEGLGAAFEKLRPFFPLEYRRAWTTPAEMARRLLTTNAKLALDFVPRTTRLRRVLAKIDPPLALGLMLVPHAMIFDARLGGHGADIGRTYQLGRRGTLCRNATIECSESCLVHTGQNPTSDMLFRAKFSKTRALLEEPRAFVRVLYESVAWLSEIPGVTPFCRLNCFSDIPWEVFCPELLAEFPRVQFYDYTKVPRRSPAGANYDLTFSYSGRNKVAARDELEGSEERRPKRLAIVFLTEKHRLPSSFRFYGRDYEVIDGDGNDFRPFDPPSALTFAGGRPVRDTGGDPVIVGLSYKDPWGNAERAAALSNVSTFVVPCEENEDGALIAAEVPRQTALSETP